MSMRACLWLAISLSLTACGGGGRGGGGGNNPPPNNPPPGNPPPAGGTQIDGGLISGGVRLQVDTGVVGVELDVAVGGTGMVAGDIQDFGSVIANDITSDTDTAEFIVEGAVSSQAALKQGQQVLIVGNATTNVATQVLYRANVKGPATSVTVVDALLGRAEFTVFGQTVSTDATTTFVNGDLTVLAPNDLLEISGTVEANGDIQASFVERNTSLSEYKALGTVAGLTATTFTLGGLSVDYASATLDEFDGAAIADGDIVEIRGPAGNFSAPDQFTAERVELLPTLIVGGDAIGRVEGFIDRFVSAADFDVQTTPITTDGNTVYVNGDASSLALNVKVQVEGTADGNGPLLAERIVIQETNAVRAEGNVEDVDVAGRTVRVLGVTFSIRDNTEIEDGSAARLDPFDLTDLSTGDEVEVRGYIDGTSVVAVEVEREDAEDRAELRGPVTAEDAGAETLELLGVAITTSSSTDYEDENDNTITAAEFFTRVALGDFVEARWDVFSDTSQAVDQLTITGDDD